MKEVYNSFHSRRWNFKCCWHIWHKALVFTATIWGICTEA